MAHDCAVCKIIRTYLLFAVPLLVLVAASTMEEGVSDTPWFARVEIIDLLSWGCLVALIGIVSYRAYQEYYLPRKREHALLEAKVRFDEMAAEMKDADTAAGAPSKEVEP